MRTASPFGEFHFLTYFGGQGTQSRSGRRTNRSRNSSYKSPINYKKPIVANIANRCRTKTPASAKSGKKWNLPKGPGWSHTSERTLPHVRDKINSLEKIDEPELNSRLNLMQHSNLLHPPKIQKNRKPAYFILADQRHKLGHVMETTGYVDAGTNAWRRYDHHLANK